MRIIEAKMYVKYDKKFLSNNSQYSNLKWEDIAGLSLNVTEKDE